MSLFDEIRLSSTYFSNKSRLSFSAPNTDRCDLEESICSKSCDTVGTQTDDEAHEMRPCDDENRTDSNIDRLIVEIGKIKVTDEVVVNVGTQYDNETALEIEKHNVEVQTENDMVSKGIQTIGMLVKTKPFVKQHRVPFPKSLLKKTVDTQTEICEYLNTKFDRKTVETKTSMHENLNFNNSTQDSKWLECECERKHKDKLETDLQHSNLVVAEVQVEIAKYEENLVNLQSLIDEGREKNRALQSVVQVLTTKIEILQAVSENQGDVIEKVLEPEMSCVDCQTEFGNFAQCFVFVVFCCVVSLGDGMLLECCL